MIRKILLDNRWYEFYIIVYYVLLFFFEEYFSGISGKILEMGWALLNMLLIKFLFSLSEPNLFTYLINKTFSLKVL